MQGSLLMYAVCTVCYGPQVRYCTDGNVKAASLEL